MALRFLFAALCLSSAAQGVLGAGEQPGVYEAYVDRWAKDRAAWERYVKQYGNGEYAANYSDSSAQMGGASANYSPTVSLYASMAGAHPSSSSADWQGRQQEQVAAWHRAMAKTVKQYVPPPYRHFAIQAMQARAASGGNGGYDQYVQGGAAGGDQQHTGHINGSDVDDHMGNSYQSYLDEYAGEYMGQGNTSEPGYQSYIGRYAGSNIGQGSQPRTSGSRMGPDANQENYAGAYVRPGHANASGADYEHFIDQYASSFMSGHGSAMGGDYQSYIDKYAGGYMGSRDNATTAGQQSYPHRHAAGDMGHGGGDESVGAHTSGLENGTGASHQSHGNRRAGDHMEHARSRDTGVDGTGANTTEQQPVLALAAGAAPPANASELRGHAEDTLQRLEAMAQHFKQLAHDQEGIDVMARRDAHAVAQSKLDSMDDVVVELRNCSEAATTCAKRAQQAIDALRQEGMEALKSERRAALHAAHQAARQGQEAARHLARQVRGEGDALVRADRGSEAEALHFELRAEVAADRAEREAEELARRRESALRHHFSKAEDQVRHWAATMPSATPAAQLQFLAQRPGNALSALPASAGVVLLAGLACGVLAPVGIRSYRRRQRTAVLMPELALG